MLISASSAPAKASWCGGCATSSQPSAEPEEP